MSDEVKPPQHQEIKIIDRDFEMFKDYCAGMSAENLGTKYQLTRQAVYNICSRDKWKQKKKKLLELEFTKFKEERKLQIKKLATILISDVDLIAKLQTQNPNQRLDKDTFMAVHKFYETLTKEVNLDDGKPTEINHGTQVHRHEVVLPQGVKGWGVIPPISEVKHIELKPEDVEKKQDEENEDF